MDQFELNNEASSDDMDGSVAVPTFDGHATTGHEVDFPILLPTANSDKVHAHVNVTCSSASGYFADTNTIKSELGKLSVVCGAKNVAWEQSSNSAFSMQAVFESVTERNIFRARLQMVCQSGVAWTTSVLFAVEDGDVILVEDSVEPQPFPRLVPSLEGTDLPSSHLEEVYLVLPSMIDHGHDPDNVIFCSAFLRQLFHDGGNGVMAPALRIEAVLPLMVASHTNSAVDMLTVLVDITLRDAEIADRLAAQLPNYATRQSPVAFRCPLTFNNLHRRLQFLRLRLAFLQDQVNLALLEQSLDSGYEAGLEG